MWCKYDKKALKFISTGPYKIAYKCPNGCENKPKKWKE